MSSNHTSSTPIFGNGADNVFDNFLFEDGSQILSGNQDGKDKNSLDGKFDDDSINDQFDDDGKKRKSRARGPQRSMTEEQKVERRERNREHAKRSRVRKKFLLESLQQSVNVLRGENEKLRSAIREHVADDAEKLLASCRLETHGLLTNANKQEMTTSLDNPDFGLIKALQTTQQNFVITDPSMPDNPIVYASEGFLLLTGYNLQQVLGRNCRFLQGPETDPKAVDRIRKGIETGEDTNVIIMNYRVDGSKFWNQFFVAALRDGEGHVVNYLGVQCKVSEEYARAVIRNENNGNG